MTTGGARAIAAEDEWVRAHAVLSRLARERAAADAEEGRGLLLAWRASVHVHLGYGSFAEYIERLFGYKPRTTQEKLRVAEALETLPGLARALDTGELGWCAVRELTRVAVSTTENAWLEAARGKTIRQLEELVASKAPGDTPEARAKPPLQVRVLRFEVQPETFALFRDAMQELRRSAGGHLDDDAVLLSMARQVLGGPTDEGRASYQISLTVCAACGQGEQLGAGERLPVGGEVVAMAECDAQHVGQLLSLSSAANENATSPAATDRRSLRAHVGTCEPQTHASPSTTHDPPRTSNSGHGPSRRANQTIPPAVRRAVLARDQRRCRVPGCTHATFVDVHHVRPRSEGGSHTPDNLITLCSAHHRASHRGELGIELNHERRPTFRHADGSAYGHAAAPMLIASQAKVFSALRHLGFRECEIKPVLAELLADAALRVAPTERLLREALCRIRGPR